jgi:hypothetical protein
MFTQAVLDLLGAPGVPPGALPVGRRGGLGRVTQLLRGLPRGVQGSVLTGAVGGVQGPVDPAAQLAVGFADRRAQRTYGRAVGARRSVAHPG